MPCQHSPSTHLEHRSQAPIHHHLNRRLNGLPHHRSQFKVIIDVVAASLLAVCLEVRR